MPMGLVPAHMCLLCTFLVLDHDGGQISDGPDVHACVLVYAFRFIVCTVHRHDTRRKLIKRKGKIKTLFQMTATALLLAVVPDKIQFIDMCMRLGVSKVSVFTSGMVMLYVSLLLTIYSGGQYLSAAWPVLTRKSK